MKISILDAMVLVSRAVGAELAEAGLGGLLVDHGEIRISRAVDGWPVRTVWAEMSVQALGVVQAMRVQIDVEYGRMIGDHNAAIRAFVQGALDFATKHEILAAEHRRLRDKAETVANECWLEELDVSVMSVRRQSRDLLDQFDPADTDHWIVEMLMLARYDDEIVQEPVAITVRSDDIADFGNTLRNSWIPEQRALALQRALYRGGAAA
ncbi:hypothetical protein NZL82_01460 [Sphingomonas sanguinis]|uniref:hypothetical protein n=1 Tax=Sphingomonas sp. LC-1 TaxID=3110957 RepID=UPI0021BA63A9|nr:hypothetical protein [Sphingomonas sp. LC-1]MCT8000538.1 hypothetical protein [Sphingomonas sp. LC-1]